MNGEKLGFSLGLVGAPGAGKGTIATWLEEEYKFYRVCPGDLLRQEIEVESELGKKAAVFLQKGNLIPDELSILLVHQKIFEKPIGSPLLFDGYPRTEGQIHALAAADLLPNVLLQLSAEKSVLLKRILGRRIHLQSGRVYHTEFSPPKHADLDDLTLEPLTIRKDDTLELALERIRQSEERDKTLLQLFASYAQTHAEKFKFETISTECSIESLREEVAQRLAAFGIFKCDSIRDGNPEKISCPC